jgi:hypothetical protein
MEWNCHLVDFCVLKSLSKCLVHTTYLVEIWTPPFVRVDAEDY